MTTQHDERAAFEEEYRLMFPVSSADPKKFEQNGIGGYEDFQVNNAWRFWQARAALLAADGKAGGEPVAWLYTLEYGNTIADTKVSIHQLNYPFGVVGADYLRENQQGVSYVRETKLYK